MCVYIYIYTYICMCICIFICICICRCICIVILFYAIYLPSSDTYLYNGFPCIHKFLLEVRHLTFIRNIFIIIRHLSLPRDLELKCPPAVALLSCVFLPLPQMVSPGHCNKTTTSTTTNNSNSDVLL